MSEKQLRKEAIAATTRKKRFVENEGKKQFRLFCLSFAALLLASLIPYSLAQAALLVLLESPRRGEGRRRSCDRRV